MSVFEIMHPYDWVMLIVLVMTTLFGAWKGMAWQVASLASVILSFFVAMRFSPLAAPMFGDKAPLNRFLAILVLYLITSAVIWLAFRLVAGLIDRVQLKDFDRQAGAAFGAVKGVLFCVVITFFLVTLSTSGRETVLESRSGYYIAYLLDRTHSIMPEEIHEVLHPYLHRLNEELTPDASDELDADTLDELNSDAPDELIPDVSDETAGAVTAGLDL